ncbi:ABC transporter ATP-binding protein [Rathayibacter sp. CAU 1779]
MTSERNAPGSDRGRRSSALDALGLTIGYDKTVVVHDADLYLAPGQVTALIGPNGSGKSTLLRAIARLHAASSGSVSLVEGERRDDALALSRTEFARRITLLTQSRPTPSGVSVRDVVGFGRHPYRRRFRSSDPEGAAAIEHAMRVTGIESVAERGVEQLSGGQLQRVWLASCIAQDTGILLLDEPTTYLDLRYQVEILDLVRELADIHGVTVGLVLHDLDQAAAIADRVVLLDGGRVVAHGEPRDVYDATLLSTTYGIRIEIDEDAATGTLRTRAVGAHHLRQRHSNERLLPTS